MEQCVEVSFQDPPSFADVDYSIFRSGPGTAGAVSSFAQQFRLAGTFFVMDDGGESRKAVVEDRVAGGQHIVGEGDAVGDVVVAGVFSDRVILRRGTVEEELWLSFSRSGAGSEKVADHGVGEGEKTESGAAETVGDGLFGSRT